MHFETSIKFDNKIFYFDKETERRSWNLNILSFSFSYWKTSTIFCRWVLLETLDKVSPGIVNWKIANKPPIKMPFKKVENCNQVVKLGKQLKFSLVNVAGNDIVQGNKKLILGMYMCSAILFLILIFFLYLIDIFNWLFPQPISGSWCDAICSNFWRTWDFIPMERR